MTLSAVVLTRNNQDTIKACLTSLAFAHEIIIIDDHSSDNTLKIAKSFTPKIFTHSLNNDYAQQRNFALKKASGDWVLFLDSDETISPSLKQEIINAISSASFDGYQIPRHDLFLGSALRYGETGNIKLLRLGKKNAGIWKRLVHEYWDIKGSVGNLKHPILHHKNLSITQFIIKINTYTDIDAHALVSENKPFTYFELLKPPLKFLYFYIFKRGFLDGFPGLVLAFLMSLHSLIVRVKMWEYAHS